MRRVVTGLAVLLLAPAAFGQSPPAGPPKPAEMKPADADKAKQAETDKKYATLIYETVKEGVELYNNGNQEGCLRLYQGAATVLQVALDYKPAMAAALKEALATAKGQKEAPAAAFTLRKALDQAQTDLAGAKKAPATTPKPGEKQ